MLKIYTGPEAIYQAAIAGLGMALVPRFLVEDEMRAGRLLLAWPEPVESSDAYYLVYPERKGDDPAVVAFRDWLQEKAGAFEAGKENSRPGKKKKR